MRALIFPFQQAAVLAPFRSLCPDFLLPLAGKPLVEHLVEQLVMAGITKITLLCDDRSDEVAQHFGNGERWGSALTMAPVREPGALQRMARAALHDDAGRVLCLPGNLRASEELTKFLVTYVATGNVAGQSVAGGRTALLTNAATLRDLPQKFIFETVEELSAIVRQMGLLPPVDESAAALPLITSLDGFLAAQREALEGRSSGIRIPARQVGDGVWLGDHTDISPTIRVEAPVFIGSNCRITGNGQIGPNAVIASYCLVNNSDLICNSLVMSGTVTGPHTEVNGMAARGSSLVNLSNGTVVSAPDPFILGSIGAAADRAEGFMDILPAAMLLFLLLPIGLPLLLISRFYPGLSRSRRRLGNRRLKTLAGEDPRIPFTLKEFCCGPLVLRRWPGLPAILVGHLMLVGSQATSADLTDSDTNDSLFGLDVARGLFHIWEVEGDLPESSDERHARENFYEMTRTVGTDLMVLLKATITYPKAE